MTVLFEEATLSEGDQRGLHKPHGCCKLRDPAKSCSEWDDGKLVCIDLFRGVCIETRSEDLWG